MIGVDLNRLNIPIELQEKLGKASEELRVLPNDAEKMAYIDNKAKLWREVCPHLALLTGQNEYDLKCWYCESKGPGFSHHVDHFRPKGRVKNGKNPAEVGYWWLAFDWRNYRLSCQRCNTGSGKRDQFPLYDGSLRALCPEDDLEIENCLLLDPACAGDQLMLAFSGDGRVYESSDVSTYPGKKASKSIDVYDLNHVEKVEARRQVWRRCRRLANRVDRAYDQLGRAESSDGMQSAKERFAELCEEVRERISSDAPYSQMARYCFKGTSAEQVLRLA